MNIIKAQEIKIVIKTFTDTILLNEQFSNEEYEKNINNFNGMFILFLL